jgi:hypothetical protein
MSAASFFVMTVTESFGTAEVYCRDWGLGLGGAGDWGLGTRDLRIPNPQSRIPDL